MLQELQPNASDTVSRLKQKRHSSNKLVIVSDDDDDDDVNRDNGKCCSTQLQYIFLVVQIPLFLLVLKCHSLHSHDD